MLSWLCFFLGFCVRYCRRNGCPSQQVCQIDQTQTLLTALHFTTVAAFQPHPWLPLLHLLLPSVAPALSTTPLNGIAHRLHWATVQPRRESLSSRYFCQCMLHYLDLPRILFLHSFHISLRFLFLWLCDKTQVTEITNVLRKLNIYDYNMQ